MLDFITVKKLSDTQLQDLMQNIERKIGGISPSNMGCFELMCQQKETIMNELQERQILEAYRHTQMKPINLTEDELSRSESDKETGFGFL